MIIQNKYTIEPHGMCIARIESVCKQLGIINFRKVQYFNTSTYNPFTDKFDIFLKIDQRLVVFDKSTVSEKYNDQAVEFANTFTKIYDNEGNCYIVQRDVFGASKMLFLYPVKEERIDKNGKKYTVEVLKFDREGYLKWFRDVFYPKHLELIKYLISLYNLDVDLNGTILGTKNK